MKFQKKIAVVTGGCGLFGKIQIKSLMEIGYKIIVLDKGEIIETGTDEHLINKNGAYEKLYNDFINN